MLAGTFKQTGLGPDKMKPYEVQKCEFRRKRIKFSRHSLFFSYQQI
jgi:hypothetical protein